MVSGSLVVEGFELVSRHHVGSKQCKTFLEHHGTFRRSILEAT